MSASKAAHHQRRFSRSFLLYLGDDNIPSSGHAEFWHISSLSELFYTFQTAGRIDNNKREKKLSQHGVCLCSQELLLPFDGANKEPFNQTTTPIRALTPVPEGIPGVLVHPQLWQKRAEAGLCVKVGNSFKILFFPTTHPVGSWCFPDPKPVSYSNVPRKLLAKTRFILTLGYKCI